MVINIASSHRFHLLDLARELSRQGHDVRFYSYVPSKRCEKFGLDRKRCCCLLPIVALFFGLERVFPSAKLLVKWRCLAMDYFVGYTMRRCDVYIALGTVYLKSFDLAKKRFGAVTILEWGSKHIDEQQQILASIGAPLNSEFFNERSRQAYNKVDYIAVASEHVVRSFEKYKIEKSKLFKNPYGVDLSMFKPLMSDKKYDIIMVGGWSLRKGCDLIVDALKDTSFHFLHVGGIVDIPFPECKNFTHIDAVDQSQLVNYYNKAKVAVLPSREEGLAMVQAQAIACNLPVIGSVDSGAEDLKAMVAKPEFITVIREHTPQAVLEAVKATLVLWESNQNAVYAGDAISNLTWEAYGKRYDEFLQKTPK